MPELGPDPAPDAAARLPATARGVWAVRWRVGRLCLHLLSALPILALWFPLISSAHRRQLKACWARRMLGILGIELRVTGKATEGGLIVANHISWIDIFVISAAHPAVFVAKAEIRKWPLLGWLAKQADTLFIQRGSRHHAQHIAHEMAAKLNSGHSVAVFPEGTTGDGRDVMPFHAALLQPAISAGHPVQPLAIRYRDAAGKYSSAPAYIDDLSLADSIRNTLAVRGLVAELIVLPPLATGPDSERRALAAAAEAAIRRAVAGR